MLGLRTVIVAAWVGAAAFTGMAQAASPLAGIDRELEILCGRLVKASGGEATKIRSRLARLWRDREAALASLSRTQAAAASSGISQRCLLLAKNAAEPSQSAKKVFTRHKKKAKKKGASRGVVIMKETPDILRDDSGARLRIRDAASETGVPAPNGRVAKVSRAPASTPPVLEEFFPWPPPAPSDRRLLDLAQLGGNAPLATWGDVADRLIRLMRAGHYPNWGFYSAPGGFAVIPHIEQLDDESGATLAGDARWATEVKLASLNLFQRIATVQLPKGVYRSLIFVLTTDPSTSGEITDPKRALERAKRWATSGALDLPQALRGEKIADNQRFFILLYEFETEVGGKTKVNTSARWQIERHLNDAGIVLQP